MTTLTVGPLIGSVADADCDTGDDLAESTTAPADGGPLMQDLLAAIGGRLREMDRTENTQYIPTLRACFDAACDPVGASKRLYVHRNTLRYRLRRIKERCGLDLLDPAERPIAELQLRLLMEL